LFGAARECVLLHWRQSRTLSGREILLQKIHGDDCQRFVVVRFGIAARTGTGGSACDSDWNASARSVANRKAKRCNWSAASRLIFLSDGFCEAQNSVGEFYGMESVQGVCESSRENSPEEILQQLTEAVVSYSCGRPQQNDRTAALLG
jgi:hypothetical protein